MPRTLWRTLLLLTGAYWLGGTLFYITVVIHTAHDVLGSQHEFGFVTREVTRQLNLVGVAALALLLLNVLATLRRQPRCRTHLLLLSTWLTMAALHAGLFVLHPRIDRHLDPAARSVTDRRAFKSVHNAYMLVTTLQLAAGIAHYGTLVHDWSHRSDPTAL
jgi:hypothetical protein